MSEQQTMTVQQAIDLAVEHRNSGDLPKAESIFKQILQAVPNQPDALNMLGVLAHQVGKNDIALERISKALDFSPNDNWMHYNLGLVFRKLERLDEAVASYLKAIIIKPDFHEAHTDLGLALQELGRANDAIASYNKALAIEPNYVLTLYNLGVVLQEQGKFDDAITSYYKVLYINPDFAKAHSNLGVVLQGQGKLDDAVAILNKAVAIQPDFAEAHNNLGNALLDQGKLDAAAASYDKAIAINPDFAAAHNNLGVALQMLGEPYDAFTHHRRAITLTRQNNSFWAGLAQSMRILSFTSADEDLWQDLLNLLDRPAARPADIVEPIISALGHHQGFLQVFKLAGAIEPDSDIPYHPTAAQLSTIPLFLRLIALTPINDLRIERLLSFLRRSMLRETMAGNIEEDGLPFASALALQCFTNEYVYYETDDETLSVECLQQQIAELIEKTLNVPPSLIATFGAYRPLHKLPWAQKLTEREWSDDIRAVIERQILEPFTEQSLRTQIPCFTPIQDIVSKSVREQYEECPYPRWVNTGLADEAKPIGTVLKASPLNFDLGEYQSPSRPDILIAGCGTGQHSLNTASRFKDARVLAVDLSLSSLSYAERKTNELGILNIEYAQADIIELSALDRQFDLIESSGVLHHLADPFAGLKVLVNLLRPGGLIKIGLYSETARQHIVAGRSMIAKMGYTALPEDIRQCRQDIITRVDNGDTSLDKLFNMGDFYSLSECRDLLFHVQEHRFTILQIIGALDTVNLKFLGFEMKDQSTMRKFKEIYPKKNDLTSLELWHEFEQQHPDTFIGMYQFWCQKK